MSPPITLPRLLVACASVIASLAATRVQAQSGASFLGLGDLPGGTFSSTASAVSGDGRFVVGLSISGNGPEATRWHINADGTISSMLGLNDLAGGSFNSNALGISLDGSVVVGTSFSGNGQEAFRWVEGGPMVALGDLAGGGFISAASGVSVDGSVIAGNGHATQDMNGTCNPIPGSSGYRAFQWTAASGMVSLERPAELNRPQSTVAGISRDGSVIGGTIDHDPACNGSLSSLAVRWVDGRVSTIGADRRLTDVSPDGSAFVGATTGVVNGFRWTSSGGFTVIGAAAQPQAVSDQGQVVVGWQLAAGTANAFVWDQAQGLRLLKDALISHGVSSVVGWDLQVARGISDDGLTIVGQGMNPSGMLEGWIARLPSPDTDGDGLLDDWELNGVPYTDSFGAEQRYELDSDGNPGSDCDVNRKDIFVEVDAMNGFAPNPAAYIAVKAAFDTAPVSNPNGALPGIKLHVVEDELNIPVGNWTQDDTNGNGTADWPTEFDALKLTAVSIPSTLINGYFGTVDDRNSDGSSLTATARREAKAKAFRYCMFGRSLDATTSPPSTGPGGIAEIGGNDFAVTMGTWASGPTIDEHAGMFMHELGHTLGLRHGGGDDIHYKPNYYSVMNYAYTTPKDWMATSSWPLASGGGGFSRFALPTLNEDALNECAAQVTPGSALAGTIFISSYVDGSTVHPWFGRFDLAQDWNNSGGGCKDPIADDINRLPIESPASPGQTLIGHDDWAAIDLNFLDSPCFAAGVHNSGLGEPGAIDITFEENQAINNMLPPFCAGDIVNDRSVNIDDLLAVISAWGACPDGCRADITPLPADFVLNIDDLLALISAWGACR